MITNEMITAAAQRLISQWEVKQGEERGKVLGVLLLLQELDKEVSSGAGKQPSGGAEEAKATAQPG